MVGLCINHLATKARRAGLLCLTLGAIQLPTTGCISDANCGICDPHSLVVQTIAGINYAGRKVRLLDPQCEGSRCPEPFDEGEYFVEAIGPCEETTDAIESTRGPEEYCKLSPLVTAFGIEFIFNNLLDPTTVELVRKRPDNPNLFEVYDWKTQVLEIQGPITRYNGDYFPGSSGNPDLVTRAVNLACIENLRARGQDYGHEDYEDPRTDPCNTFDANTGRPLKMLAEGTTKASRGLWDARALSRGSAASCDSPEQGPDTCCSSCDFLLSQQVAKYGLDPATSDPANPTTAMTCDVMGDPLVDCRDFVVWTDRSDEKNRYHYDWCPPGQGCTDEHALPYYDKLRETHPDKRPPELERKTAQCSATAQCVDPLGHNLPGSQCVGTNASGQACSPEAGDPECTEGRCVAAWFVTCRANADTTGEQGYCVDKRFSDAGAAACFRAPDDVKIEARNPDTGAVHTTNNTGAKLAYCDGNVDGRYDAAECCQVGLGGAEAGEPDADKDCDPFFQPRLRSLPRYDRNSTLPEATRNCICGQNAAGCEDISPAVCEGRDGEYAVKLVTRLGGVIYDPAIKGFEWRPADVGAVPRAGIELCAEQRKLIEARNIEDGWRAHDRNDQEAENYEDYDRALCSGQTYRVLFNDPTDGEVEHVADKLGNTLEGKSTYVFDTPQFHVVPGSGFPTDNLRVGACDDFSIRFSNKYDLSPANLQKLLIYQADPETGELVSSRPECDIVGDFDGDGQDDRAPRPVAGGVGCAATEDEAKEGDGCRPPCLTVDVSQHVIGQVAVRIDPTEFGAVLQTGRTYSLVVPGLGQLGDAADPGAYQAAFWDVCGMPLVLGGYTGDPDFEYVFTVDVPKCKEDPDGDEVQYSCDNAEDYFNPDQGDIDRDSVGDVVDLCPTIVSAPTNTADSDDDGIGNECDNCRQATKQYNLDADTLGVPAYMRVRNIPFQDDADSDGIGDVCDNCIVVANCQDYGPDQPWAPGDPIEYANPNLCQRDDDADMLGDACQGMQDDLAAGPVGLTDEDDFDQDGIVNVVDACPRQPLGDHLECTGDDDCPADRVCERVSAGDETGVCDHLDTDGDGVGNICDTCPAVANHMQVIEGSMQQDDPDGDFVGSVCETHASCQMRTDPRAMSFYEVSVGGLCCTTQLVELDDGTLVRRVVDEDRVFEIAVEDPDGLPVTLDCTEPEDGSIPQDQRTCRRLPQRLAETPGVLVPPPGCDDALAAAGYSSPLDNPRIRPSDVSNDLTALWGSMCLVPQLDQDFDSVGDACDLCKFDYDPDNQPYIDEFGKLWPGAGKYCNGAYHIDNVCADETEPTGATGGATDTGTETSGTADTGTGG